jgi:hypothetical protein
MKMKRLLLILLLFTGPVYADVAAVTVGGQYACLSEQWLDDFTGFAVAGDQASMQAYLDRNWCIYPLKGGLRVTINDVGFVVHGFMFQGTQLYAPVEALKKL